MVGAQGDASEAAPPNNTNLFLQILQHPDGTITRPFVPQLAASTPAAAAASAPVLSKDVPLNPLHSTSLRLFLPNPLPAGEKLPILLYSHGGGFVLFSASDAFNHPFCEALAAAVPAVVVSLEYRLAPEHRLPAAYEDAVEALLWVRAHALNTTAGDPWLVRHGDFSRCFLMGNSAGANMAYHAGLRAAQIPELQPIRLAGLILSQPYFGGVERTPSELASEEDSMLPLAANDMLWRLALPEWADRDHEFCNPATAPGRPVRLPRCLVKGCRGDPLVDRQQLFVEMLEADGVEVEAQLDDTGFHAIELLVPAKAEALFAAIRGFIGAGASGAEGSKG